jgi:lipopolysaccharide export LptBFGC system permease protein LptF
MDDTNNLDNDANTIAKFNQMIEKAEELLNTTPSLEKEKSSNNLREIYFNTTKNYLTGPEQIEQSFKNYYVFEKGEQAYNEEHEKIMFQKAKIISNHFFKNFKKNSQMTLSRLESYTSLLVNFQNVKDYYLNLSNEYPNLTNKLKIKNADILTKNRKSFYEDQGINSLKFYYNIFFYIYLFILIVFLICIFLSPSSYSRGQLFIIFIIMILYLYIAEPIFNYLIKIGKKGLEVLPKNIYKSI